MKLGFEEIILANGSDAVIPIDSTTGEHIEGVLACSVSCAFEELTTMTIKVYAHQKTPRGKVIKDNAG